jgi:hypothetical protein
MPEPRPRHLHPLEDPSSGQSDDSSPAGWPDLERVSPEEDERFSEWLAFAQRSTGGDGSGMWEEPRWQEPPAHLFERFAGRLRRKRARR